VLPAHSAQLQELQHVPRVPLVIMPVQLSLCRASHAMQVILVAAGLRNAQHVQSVATAHRLGVGLA